MIWFLYVERRYATGCGLTDILVQVKIAEDLLALAQPVEKTHTRYGEEGGRVTKGAHISIAAMKCNSGEVVLRPTLPTALLFLGGNSFGKTYET